MSRCDVCGEENDLSHYRVLVLALACLPFPHPTEKDYQFIETMWSLGASYKATAKILSIGEITK